MHYSIQYDVQAFPNLHISPRKPALKHKLLSVTQGLILVKIGKTEYTVCPGEFFWVPANCLSSVTAIQRSIVAGAEISQRTAGVFPLNAGYVKPGQLVKSVFAKLSQEELSQEYRDKLLQVIRFEVQELKPELNKNPLTEKINAWKPDQTQGLDEQLHHPMLVREARRRVLSGEKKERVAASLFKMETAQFDRLCIEVLGAKL